MGFDRMKVNARLIELMAAGAQAPEWVCLLPAGRLTTQDGLTYLVDEAGMASILAANTARGVELVIDYEHQTHEGVEAPAAGWIKELAARPDGLWGRVQWNERGRAYVANREYRYLSPVIMVEQGSRRVVELLDVALTNSPRINNFPPITNKSGDEGMNWLERLRMALALAAEAGEAQVAEAAEKAINSGRALLTTLRTLVGLDDKATPEAVLEAVKVEVNKAKAKTPEGGARLEVIPNSVRQALKLGDGAGESEVLAAIKGLVAGSDQLVSVQARLEALEATNLEQAANSLVDRFTKEGKVIPATREEALAWAKKDPKAFEAYMNKAPKLLPTDRLPGGGGTGGQGSDGIDPVQAELNRMLGIEAEMFKQHNPASEEV
jgi:phage I-like protein